MAENVEVFLKERNLQAAVRRVRLAAPKSRTVFLQEHFYVSAIEIEFRICFRVLAGSKAAEVLLQSI